MKEYICKQELDEILNKRIEEERITARVLSDVGRGVELASIVADSLNTVTKAYICREFADKVKSKMYYSDDLQKDFGISSKQAYIIFELLDNVVAEMREE